MRKSGLNLIVKLHMYGWSYREGRDMVDLDM